MTYTASCSFHIPASTVIHFGILVNFDALESFVLELPHPLARDSFPVTSYHEPLLITFPRAFLLSRMINFIISTLGFLMASFLFSRCRKSNLSLQVRTFAFDSIILP